MRIYILTLFPEMFSGPFDFSLVARARKKDIVTIHYVNIRDFSTDAYKTVDDHPYGGGRGMILKVDVVDRAIRSVRDNTQSSSARTILLDPQGTPYTQGQATHLTSYETLVLVCGHYEGVDERIRKLVDEEISVGDYILSGGEIPAMILIDSVVRLLPGVLEKEGVTLDESFSGPTGLLEYPQYTRPERYVGMGVPALLRSGNHAKIAAWQKRQAGIRTRKRRPDIIRPKEKKDRS